MPLWGFDLGFEYNVVADSHLAFSTVCLTIGVLPNYCAPFSNVCGVLSQYHKKAEAIFSSIMDIGLWHNNDNDGPWSRIRPLQHRNCAIEIATAFEMEYMTQQRDALFIISEAKYEAYLTNSFSPQFKFDGKCVLLSLWCL